MNEKEAAELRRRFRPDKNSITHIHGCCVNERREIVNIFHQPLSIMPQEEAEKLLGVLKRVLSGAPDKNRIPIEFATSQVAAGEEHKLLMDLRSSGLKDEELLKTFFGKIAQSLTMEGSYLILLASDAYDVSYHSSDGEEPEDSSQEVFHYFVCGICPVKPTKPALGYFAHENAFHSCHTDWVVAPPELGFLFPAFDDRCANIYGALYYTKSPAESHREFTDALFCTELPMPALQQKETFQTVLGEALDEACSYEVVQAVHDQLCELIAEQKENPEEPAALPAGTVERVLEACGVEEHRVAAFTEKYEEAFGQDAPLRPGNLVDARQVEVRTPDVTVRVNPERSDLVETRILNGVKYILIRAEGQVEVNGVDVRIL